MRSCLVPKLQFGHVLTAKLCFATRQFRSGSIPRSTCWEAELSSEWVPKQEPENQELKAVMAKVETHRSR